MHLCINWKCEKTFWIVKSNGELIFQKKNYYDTVKKLIM